MPRAAQAASLYGLLYLNFDVMNTIKTIVVEDVALELKGTLAIIGSDIPEIQVVGTARSESELHTLFAAGTVPDLVLLDLGLGGSTTVGVDICRWIRHDFPQVKVLVFTGELNGDLLWAHVIEAGAHGLVLKTGDMLTRSHVMEVMRGGTGVFSQPVLDRLVQVFCTATRNSSLELQARMTYDIDEFDERFLRHLALGYTKDMISDLRSMPFSSKSLEKRQADLIARLFPEGQQHGVNVTRLVVRAIELHIIDPFNLEPDE